MNAHGKTRLSVSAAKRWGLVIVAALLFVFSVELMKGSAHALQPILESAMPHVMTNWLSALGAAWVASYILVSGSVVAAISLTFFESGLLGPLELVMMIFGSRFGASGIVVVVGLLDAASERDVTVEKGSAMGFLTFLTAFAVGIPAAGLAWLWLASGVDVATDIQVATADGAPGLVRQLVSLLISTLGAGLSFLLAAGGLFAALKLFDKALERFDLVDLTRRFSTALDNRWWAALIGLGITLMTTSVAFSVAALVPLFDRDVIARRQAIPYLLGAHVGTLGDTLLISILLDEPAGVEITLVVIAALFVVAAVLMLAYRPFEHLLLQLEHRLTRGKAVAIASLIALVLVPLGLVATTFL